MESKDILGFCFFFGVGFVLFILRRMFPGQVCILMEMKWLSEKEL